MGDYNISIFNIATSIGKIADLVDFQLTGHHRRVAYIAGRITEELQFSEEEQDEVILAALVHDIGALSTQERVEILDFKSEDRSGHAENGYKLLRLFNPATEIAEIVKNHHMSWEDSLGKNYPIGAHIIYIADRIDTLINTDKNVLLQVKEIKQHIISESGKMFMPELVEAFVRLSKKEAFWLDSVSGIMVRPRSEKYKKTALSEEDMIQLGLFFSQIIDFRSRFTATHSSGIAAVSCELAKLRGFDEKECILMRFAGYVHDIGKLAVPAEIIEKPGKLTDEEYSLMKMHTYYTYQILGDIEGLEKVAKWAAYHHEKIDGTGYPFGVGGKELDEGCKIMKVADVFTALTEERPYRKAMAKDQVIDILDGLDEDDEEFANIINVLKQNYNDLDNIRARAQQNAIERYQIFIG